MQTRSSPHPKSAWARRAELQRQIHLAAHNFRFTKRAEHAIQARIRQTIGVSSLTKITADQHERALALAEELMRVCRLFQQASAEAETQFLKKFIRDGEPAPLAPVLKLTDARHPTEKPNDEE